MDVERVWCEVICTSAFWWSDNAYGSVGRERMMSSCN
jgi:hypothetical protein